MTKLLEHYLTRLEVCVKERYSYLFKYYSNLFNDRAFPDNEEHKPFIEQYKSIKQRAIEQGILR